jgi:hypothetical protein
MVIVIITIVLSYFTGYETCDEHYKQYYDATETMLDSIDENYMLDVIMETDAYQDYLKAKEEL